MMVNWLERIKTTFESADLTLSFVHLFIHSFIHWLSLTHSLTYSLTLHTTHSLSTTRLGFFLIQPFVFLFIPWIWINPFWSQLHSLNFTTRMYQKHEITSSNNITSSDMNMHSSFPLTNHRKLSSSQINKAQLIGIPQINSIYLITLFEWKKMSKILVKLSQNIDRISHLIEDHCQLLKNWNWKIHSKVFSQVMRITHSLHLLMINYWLTIDYTYYWLLLLLLLHLLHLLLTTSTDYWPLIIDCTFYYYTYYFYDYLIKATLQSCSKFTIKSPLHTQRQSSNSCSEIMPLLLTNRWPSKAF